jgi:ferredoxin
MKLTRIIPTRRLRILVQGGFFGLWCALIWATRHPIDSALAQVIPTSLFLRIDPLVMTAVSGGLRAGITLTLLGAVTLVVTLLLGRVFCGWVCPLGSIFDAYGWILKQFGHSTEGPSPPWFRFKYLLLLAILVLTLFGAANPLMGLDPIVLLTRTAAVVLAPLGVSTSTLLENWGSTTAWKVPTLFREHWVDAGTLFLFVAIMGGTTRLSRIWCRTACPLGAYLAVASRHSVLRRQTRDCTKCNLCIPACPTGAISLTNPLDYNESECIKCFSCSSICPVEANFFTLKNPLPSSTDAYAPVSLERRSVLATAVGAVASVPYLQVQAGGTGATKALIRPPFARDEGEFLSSCIRCGECMKACPTSLLKPSGLENGLRALWSPVMDADHARCLPECNACSQACPTDALLKYPLEAKYSRKAGTAVLNASLCVAHAENKYCNECVRSCPTDAITVLPGWKPEQATDRGSDQPAPEGQHSQRPVSIVFDRCIGCGACQEACHEITFGDVAMKVTATGRGLPSDLTRPHPISQDFRKETL